MTYPIGDMLIRIKNASQARKESLKVAYSRFGQTLAQLLVEKGYLSGVKVSGEGIEKALEIELKYNGRKTVVNGVKQISKPGLRRYSKASDLVSYRRTGNGLVILSTPKGLMSLDEAKKQKIGGELLFEVW